MKELSTEEKAKAYDKALEKAQKWYDANTNEGYRGIFEDIFPELKESEDERIIKAIKSAVLQLTDIYLQEKYGLKQSDCIAWLEKQGDANKEYWRGYREGKQEILDKYAELEKQGEHYNFRNKIQIGDKVTRNEDGVLVNLSQLKRVAKKEEKQGEQKFSNIDNKFIRMRETKPKDISEFLDRLTTVEQEFLWEHIAKIRELDKEEQKPADKVEPKFHEGEWITNGDYTWKIVEVKPLDYILQAQDGNVVDDTISHVDEQFHSFTIEDAKDGDVLADGNLPFIFKNIDANKYSYAYCGISVVDGFTIESDGESGEWTWMQDIKPATKEQRDQLEKAMTDAGYTFDFEKKELKKIKQKSAWSEEDEEMLDSIIEEVRYIGDFPDYPTKEENELYDECLAKVEWLKSLKERVQQPKQEWSIEDESHIRYLIECLEHCKKGVALTMTTSTSQEYINWLKSLRPQKQWKPSDEQIKVCKEVYADILSAKGFDLGTVNGELNRLEAELKKLKE